jgi:DNA (cytosine-5)-methyltransferase 1
MGKSRNKRKLNEFPDSSGEDATPVPPDPSGWSPHPSERRDLYHRVRVFPPDVAAWRQRLAQHVQDRPDLFPNAPTDRDQLFERLDAGISYLREVARVLAVLYGTPNLGNKQDPTDELVYIILSRKTPAKANQDTFAALKARFLRWDDLLDAPREEVERLVSPGGLAGKKATSLFGALRIIRETFGRCSLDPAREWPDDRLESFLCSLPEVQRKSAYCIMMYAFGRQVFPADTHVGRVLARLGPYRELGLSLVGLDHKKLQKILSDLAPPNLRYSLHVNLVEHGRGVCKAVRPLCGQCELRNFCRYYRQAEAARVVASDMPTAADLFAGAGGLSEGFTQADFRILFAIDRDPEATKTYRLNHPQVPDDCVLTADITAIEDGGFRRLAGPGRVDVLIGSPPCQGYSTAGFRSKKTATGYRPEGDDRNFLFEQMVRAAVELRPRLFLMENVPGMQSARKENLSFLEAAARMLEEQAGFMTTVWRLNASAFGVPQDRIRFFLVASSTGILPARPAEEYQDIHRADLDHDALPPVTLGEAIFDLPPQDAGTGVAVGRRELPDTAADRRFRRFLGKFGVFRPSPLLYNHTVRYHNARDLELYRLLKPGEDSVHLLERHGRDDLMRYRKDVFDDKYARLRADRPSKTIVAHLAKDGNGYIHPDQPRSISLREAARVQSFHDGFAFCGSPSDQWVQLGNAVPPVLARAIALSFLRALERS